MNVAIRERLSMNRPMRALVAGSIAVVRAPLMIVVTVAATMLTALPFALVVGGRLQSSLGHQPAIDLQAEEIDAEWWLEYRRHARGLEATFTPAIMGAAAPLDNLSALADGSPRPLLLALPVALYLVVWSFLWGGVLNRLHGRRGARTFWAASVTHFRHLAIVSALATLLVLLLYGTLHRLMFGPVFASIATAVSNEPEVFAVRAVLYALFAGVLALVSLCADYTRIDLVKADNASVRAAWHRARAFIRANWGAVIALYLCTAALFAMILIAYAAADQRFSGWRIVILGQAFIVARLVLRLIVAASEMRLYDMSRVPANPGPPAAT
jgi:hypothetical protein